MKDAGRITAVLGPTNTGKTHYAIERMLGHRTGVIGLPLRLLAREVYDRIVAVRGPNAVALVTGEERIVPARAAYWVCTVEAMPVGQGHDFLAVDEIQLCADPERGHVFTDRLLNARGLHETLFMGAETMRPAIASLVPRAQFMRRERFSTLTYTGPKKISRMKHRSAIVGFSVENVYAIAELLRRQKGGAAVVMGALSPRTRNAQVELYQNGDVEYLVATDAIGMGLNLDIDHVAFSSTTKFDGRRMRPLQPNELAQIAGRAGRHTKAGTFGVTGEAGPIDDEVVEAIQESSFRPVRRLMWRNSDLSYGSVGALIGSLEARTENEWLGRARDADDLRALKWLAEDEGVMERARGGTAVRLLWDVCRIPDFRGISPGEHAELLRSIFRYLHEFGRVPDDWMARQVKRVDRTEGDIDTLSKRLAYVRTWTYLAQREGWLDDASHWRGETRAVEDRLSDALHGALTQRFVDRRTSVLLRRLKQKEAMLAEIDDKGIVTVEGETLGRIEGFRFRMDAAKDGEAKTLRAAANQVLTPAFSLRADRFYNAPDTEMDITEQGGLMWGDSAVGRLAPGDDPLTPKIVAFVDDEAGADAKEKVERRLRHFVDRRVNGLFEPLVGLRKDETLQGLARGLAFRLVEGFGVVPRAEIAGDVKSLGQEERATLRKHGVRFGQFTVFLPALLKPAPTRLRLVLWGLAKNLQEFPEAPPPGLVTVPEVKGAPQGYYAMAGYRLAGERAIRIDMLERLADMIRQQDTRGGFEASQDMLSITGLSLDGFATLLQGLGYKAEKGERPKPVRAAPGATVASDVPGPGEPQTPGEVPVETPGEDVPVPQEAPPEVPDTQPEPPTGPTDPDIPQPDPPQVPDTPDDPRPGEAPDEGPVAPPTEVPDVTPGIDPGGPGDVPVMTAPPVDEGGADATPPEETAAEGSAEPEVETFYTFTWAGNRPRNQGRGRQAGRANAGGQQRQNGKGPRRDAKGKGGKPQRGDRDGRENRQGGKPKTYASAPLRKDRIDPDNPFAAALMGLRDKD